MKRTVLPKARVPGYLIMLVNSLLRPLHSSSSRMFKTLNNKWPLRSCALHFCSTGMITPPPPPPPEWVALSNRNQITMWMLHEHRLNHVNNDFFTKFHAELYPRSIFACRLKFMQPYLCVAGQRLFWKARMYPISSACLTVLQCFNLIW